MHEGRVHFSHRERSLPAIPYMLAEGPPRSVIVPRKSGMAATRSTSRSTEASERGVTNLPWCAEMVQKAQPPKHPRCIVIEWRIIR